MTWTHQAIEEIRTQAGKTVLLFITDRCPVGCAHCSVDSRSDSPCITNGPLFDTLLNTVCNMPSIEVVGISGGEPFVERKGLSVAVEQITQAGKDVVIYTSGVWAKQGNPPPWVNGILQKTATVVLSTDAFHQQHVSPAQWMHAAKTAAECGCWLIVQTLDTGAAQALLEEAFGPEFTEYAEVVPLHPLRNGRGQQVFAAPIKQHYTHFMPCKLAHTPVIRYDGRTSACCNEDVVMNQGPARFRSQASTSAELTDQWAAWQLDPLLSSLRNTGFDALMHHPKLKDLQDKKFGNACDLCWTIAERFSDPGEDDLLLKAIAQLELNP
ncbi:MAG TPA: hypothetical protein VGE55_07210 [Limnobacter sp.]|uniref:hypothetical protein n=1 Tax=Limnobacter sp. TaxID=2003368 RepID=UPI002EDA3141